MVWTIDAIFDIRAIERVCLSLVFSSRQEHRQPQHQHPHHELKLMMKWLLSKHRLVLKRSRHGCDPGPVAPPGAGLLKFDESSGQMYTETTISTRSSEARNWTRPHRMSLKSIKHQPRPRKGTRSLVDAAIETILENLVDVTFEGVDCLPKKLVLRIWILASERYVIPFCVWEIFSKVLRAENNTPLSLLRFRHVIPSPRMSLQTYTTTLTSSNFDFLASISLTTAFSVPQLVKLSSVKNLCILEIVHTSRDGAQSGISDRLIRAWHQAARDEGPFSVLRILKLWDHKEVTETSLTYLNSFPVLALFDVRGCTFDARSRVLARTFGWRSSFDVGILSLFEAICVKRAVNKRAAGEADRQSIRRASSQQLDEDCFVNRIPRADVATFITSLAFSTSKENANAVQQWDSWQSMGDLSDIRYSDKSFKETRCGIANQHIFNTCYSLETWDFVPYTIFSKIGELRSDRDLHRAGVNIGEQVVVNDELVNSVPVASLRLGPHLEVLKPPVYNSPNKPLYGSAFTERSDPHFTKLTRDHPKNQYPALVDIKPAVTPDIGSIAFFRVEAPCRISDFSASQEVSEDKMTKVEKKIQGSTTDSKRGFFAEPLRRHSKLMQNKKQKLVDVLGTFC
ncbi:hypothetical protein ONS95_006714 [Cadophora gregata]|uniref:uncharacterized protein n=1 Tax=Cadophora gregata TaxID=51156 RepID=UPI0026DD3F91|nr:uncharacterized protein ONS95_006714 [Cadophora gregata]KAK0101547.1 hypothetical protein ONS95_006714 [Cadophora gregata]